MIDAVLDQMRCARQTGRRLARHHRYGLDVTLRSSAQTVQPENGAARHTDTCAGLAGQLDQIPVREQGADTQWHEMLAGANRGLGYLTKHRRGGAFHDNIRVLRELGQGHCDGRTAQRIQTFACVRNGARAGGGEFEPRDALREPPGEIEPDSAKAANTDSQGGVGFRHVQASGTTTNCMRRIARCASCAHARTRGIVERSEARVRSEALAGHLDLERAGVEERLVHAVGV